MIDHSHIERKRRTIAAIEGTPMKARQRFAASFRERHPYIEAQRLFCLGRIPVAQAVGMMLSDPDYIAECELSMKDARVYAEVIVRDQWARQLLAVSNG